MRRRYKRKSRAQGDVELNMTAMLDMAFQLLAFFILTFRPSAVESQVSLRMPPSIGAGGGGAIMEKPEDLDATKSPLPIRIRANGDGEIAEISISGSTIPGSGPLENVMGTVNATLASKLAGSPFDSVALEASQNLIYERLMQVVEICTRQTLPATGEPLTKISVAELPGGQ